MSHHKKSMHQKYATLFIRTWMIDDSITGMEWMHPDYVMGTFRNATENVSFPKFFLEILDACLIDIPNPEMFMHHLGIFEEKNTVFYSTEIFNKNINEIVIEVSDKHYIQAVGNIRIYPDKEILTSISDLSNDLLMKQQLKEISKTETSYLYEGNTDDELIVLITLILNKENGYIDYIEISYP